MKILKENLAPEKNNSLTGYFPARTNYSENDEAFNWDVAGAMLIRNLFLKDLNSLTLGEFEARCKQHFNARLDEAGLWDYIKEMYFTNSVYFQISPEFKLFHLAEATKSQHRLGDLFISLLQGYNITTLTQVNRNFLEQQVVDSLASCLKPYTGNGKLGFKGNFEDPYLPFLTDYFQRDIAFLAKNPKYFIAVLKDFMMLYAYLYTAQLALNIKGYPNEPTSKPLYFIMESETASEERIDLRVNGHQKVSNLLENIFPYLTMSESLQNPDFDSGERRQPLWRLAQSLTPEDIPNLIKYAEEFAEQRFKEPYEFPDGAKSNPIECLRELLRLSLKQFERGQTRAAAQGKVIKGTEQELCGNFVKNRGKSGRVLVMNQDYLLLLTNIAIGEKGKIRFHELLHEFEARGVFFDKKSQQTIIKFYERVGNVERMSDSGDAVYVRKTI